MDCFVALLLAMTAIAGTTPAHALDCAKASARVDKVICASPSLKKADAAMSAAYFKLLRATTDREFHDALIRSQRRWLEARSQGARGNQQPDDDDEDTAERKALLNVTHDRMESLQTGKLVQKMERQRGVASKDSGGAFAGYKTSCYLLPLASGWVYGCSGEGYRQNNDRICSVEVDSGPRQTDYRTVSILKDGAPKPVATCSIGYGGITCPGASDDAEIQAIAHWNTNPIPSSARPIPRASELSKYDADTPVELADEEWMHDCLSAATYPPADVSRADPPPKRP